MTDEIEALKKALGGEKRFDAIIHIVHDFYYDALDLVAPAGAVPPEAIITQEAMFFAFIQWLETRSLDDIETSKGFTLNQFVELLEQRQYIEYQNGVFRRLRPNPPFGDLEVIYSPVETDERDILVTLRPKKG
ncbi:MAG: hypothetical protein WCE82_01035 [Halobacteriota archaeon]